ncbi:MAG TPA: histidine kinase [Acidimicrobiia bacterium]|nr:histidine kinase [Acidimicrobiia bacterium]
MTAPGVASDTIDLRPRMPELLLAAAAIAFILIEIWVLDRPELRLARSAVGIVAGSSLAFLRAHPFAAYLANGTAIVTLIALGQPSDFYQWTNLIAIIGAGSRLDSRRALLVLGYGLAGVAFYFLRFPDEAPLALAVAVGAVWVTAWFGGRLQYSRIREAELKLERDMTRAELSARQAEAALEDERSRIARELHDIIGHSVNVMVLHAGAGKGELARDQAAAGRSFDTIAATGRKALADLDRVLDVLHGGADNRPLPGVGDLAELCAGVSGTGVEVDLSLRGDTGLVSGSLGLTVYRIVQEALTNVIKHSGATKASVEVTIDDEVAICVIDDGKGSTGEPGRGLQNITQRAALHGGTVTYGDRPEGGFMLRCRLSLEASA